MAKTSKLKNLPIETFIPLDLSKNIRDPSGSTLNIEPLIPDIKQHGGLKVRILVHFKDGKFDRVIQGYRRTSAYVKLHEMEPNDKRWDEIPCEVYEDLSPAELMDKMVDSGNTESLKPYEVVRAIWMTIEADPKISDADLTTRCEGILAIHWPPSPKKKTRDEIVANHRGTIQCIRYAYDGPHEMQKTYMDIVKDGSSVSYRKKDFSELRRTFLDEMRSDHTGLTNKANPGPKFTTLWNAFVKSEEEKRNNVKIKAVSAMSKAEMQTVADNTASLLLKNTIAALTRQIQLPDRKIQIYGLVLARDIEPHLTKETRQNLLAVMEGRFADAGFPD